jgi:TPR repeat protein/serine/threonine protein kinase
MGSIANSNQGLQPDLKIGRLFADAEAGVVPAQFELAQAYENGTGIVVDIPESIRWLRIAADNQHPGALYRLGVAFQRGISLQQDSSAAVECFTKGAELGDIPCQCALADAYRDGRGIAKDETVAVHWYTKASEQGNANAQYRLGKMYRYGAGVQRDIASAIQFFNAAAEQGHAEAAAALEKAKVLQSSQPAKAIKAQPEQPILSEPQPKRTIPFVMIDTSVLMKDPDVVRRVTENKGIPCVCYAVLSELDHNKTNETRVTPGSTITVGVNAKTLLRELAKTNPLLLQDLPEGGKPIQGDLIQQFSFMGNPLLVFTRKSQRGNFDNDAKIIAIAHDYGMIIITADSGLQVRAQAQGVEGALWTGPNHAKNKAPNAINHAANRPQLVPFELCKTPISEKPSLLRISAIPKEGDTLSSGNPGTVRLVKTLSAGGEGTIFETDHPDRVCKIYHKDRLTSTRQKKIELMLSRKIVKEGICWPIDFVKNADGQFVGYLMPRANGKPMQHTMFVKPVLEKSFPAWSRIDLVNLCNAFLDKIQFLHSLNIIVGDINPLNILITEQSNKVWIVDTDSFQIEGFPCPVGTVNFTAPQIQGINYAEFMRTREHELFAVATMLFMILHPGKPPYAQEGGGDPAENIKKKNFAYPVLGKDVTGRAPQGPWQNIWANLHKDVQKAFWETFKESRPVEIGKWKGVLRGYKTEILNGKYSNELFPTTFRITDPINVLCGNCSETVVASERRYQKMIDDGKPYLCGKCVANFRLRILAAKAREAHQSVKTGRSNSAKTSFYTQPPKSPRKTQYQQNSSSARGVVSGIFDAIFNLFR